MNSRYYNPEWCRFINADGIIGANRDILSSNLYLYVSNNPVIHNDVDGYGLGVALLVGAAVYFGVKKLITITSNAYLSSKGYSVSRYMFNKAMYNPIGNISKRVQREIEEKSKNTSQVQNSIKTCVAKNSNSQSFIGCKVEDVEFDGDLYYSIQHIDIVVSGKKNFDSSWDISINMREKYDFTKRRGLNNFSNAANDLGFYMQHTGMLTPYTWSVQYQLVYKDN